MGMRSSVRLDCFGLLCGISIGSSLVSIPLMRHSLGYEGATSAGFVVAAFIAVTYWVRRRLPAESRFAITGVALGALSFPLLCLVVASAGLLVGLEPMCPAPALRGSSLSWMNALVLAPLFEEVLYRSLLIDLLRPRIGLLGAFAVSTALFAVSHISPWGIVSGVVVGGFLAAVVARTGRLDLCVGIHAGLNLVSLGLGMPPSIWSIAGSMAVLGVGAVVVWLSGVAPTLLDWRRSSANNPPAVSSVLFEPEAAGP
jgi:membrane protease YdiL (CAAX protease family)